MNSTAPIASESANVICTGPAHDQLMPDESSMTVAMTQPQLGGPAGPSLGQTLDCNYWEMMRHAATGTVNLKAVSQIQRLSVHIAQSV